MPRRPLSCLLALSLSLFSLPGCVTLLGKRTQSVIVTSSPAAARVLVDGAFEGLAPLGLRAARRTPHVIRFEAEGYRPVEIRLKRRKNWPVVIIPNLTWALLGLPALANVDVQTDRDRIIGAAFITLGLAAPVAAMLIDGSSAKSNRLEPRHITVTLEKDGGGSEPVFLSLDAAEWRQVAWISVLESGRASGPRR